MDGSDVIDQGAKVYSKDGKDVTAEYLKGAKMSLDIALENEVGQAIFGSCYFHRCICNFLLSSRLKPIFYSSYYQLSLLLYFYYCNSYTTFSVLTLSLALNVWVSL